MITVPSKLLEMMHALMIQSKIFWQGKEYEYLRDQLEDTGVLEGEKLD